MVIYEEIGCLSHINLRGISWFSTLSPPHINIDNNQKYVDHTKCLLNISFQNHGHQ